MDWRRRLQIGVLFPRVWQEVVQDYEIHWGKKLELDKEQIFFIILKQGENFESIRPPEEGQEEKIKNGEKLQRF